MPFLYTPTFSSNGRELARQQRHSTYPSDLNCYYLSLVPIYVQVKDSKSHLPRLIQLPAMTF